MKRPASKLSKAVQAITKRTHRATDLYLVGRWNHLDLTVAACKHLYVTGKDSNGMQTWVEEKDRFDIYLQQNRRLIAHPSLVFREGICFGAYWEGFIELLTRDQIASLVTVLDDVAKMQDSKAEQGGTSMGQEIWSSQSSSQADQDEAGPNTSCEVEVF